MSTDTLNFNPRTPCGVRRCHPSCTQTGCPISIHAPLAGCDLFASPFGVTSSISIHAPLAGCDAVFRHFVVYSWGFQSTHPLRGATSSGIEKADRTGFQSTHPLRGATLSGPGWTTTGLHFNPRTPCGVRLQTSFQSAFNFEFQSTHPLRGATVVS